MRHTWSGHVCAGATNTIQNTIGPSITVHYPFHPLHGKSFDVAYCSRSHAGTVTVFGPGEKRLRLPLWMVSPEAEQFRPGEEPAVAVTALLRVCELVSGVASAFPDPSSSRRPVSGDTVTGARPSHGRGSEQNATTGLSGSIAGTGSPGKGNEFVGERPSKGCSSEEDETDRSRARKLVLRSHPATEDRSGFGLGEASV
jgi:hypothetical protein